MWLTPQENCCTPSTRKMSKSTYLFRWKTIIFGALEMVALTAVSCLISQKEQWIWLFQVKVSCWKKHWRQSCWERQKIFAGLGSPLTLEESRVVFAYYYSTLEVEAGGSWIWDQPCNTRRLYLSNKHTNKITKLWKSYVPVLLGVFLMKRPRSRAHHQSPVKST